LQGEFDSAVKSKEISIQNEQPKPEIATRGSSKPPKS
jgi:hypothetical protein